MLNVKKSYVLLIVERRRREVLVVRGNESAAEWLKDRRASRTVPDAATFGLAACERIVSSYYIIIVSCRRQEQLQRQASHPRKRAKAMAFDFGGG